MEILRKFVIFVDNIMSIKIIGNINILDILIYMILIRAIIEFIETAIKGKN